MLLGVGLPTLALAQDEAAATDDEIVVTGSRIPSANAVTASPVTTIGNVEFDIRGTTRAEDLVNTLPQAFAAQGANTSNGATGTAQVNLRGLGSNRTLVLVDGRRLQYGSAISSAPDLNQIPSALVERVEVLTGGASAVYGSDAIAGVVNFIMIKDFEGVRIDGQLSGYQHTNNNEVARIRARCDSAVSRRRKKACSTAKARKSPLIIGANTEDGRGNVTAYAGYRNNDAILQATVIIPRVRYQARLDHARRVRSVFGCARIGDRRDRHVLREQPAADRHHRCLYARSDDRQHVHLRQPTFSTSRRRTSISVPTSATRSARSPIMKSMNTLDTMRRRCSMTTRRTRRSRFRATSSTRSTVNCDNPLLSAQQASIICGVNAGVAGQVGGVYVLRRLVEGSPRNDHIRLTSFRMCRRRSRRDHGRLDLRRVLPICEHA